MFELKQVELPARSGVQLTLYRYTDSAEATAKCPRKPVLLLHGASANHGTFTIPDGGLVSHLARNFDPWLLDWRGSGRTVDDERNKDSLSTHGAIYNFNHAAREDLPYAIEKIQYFTEHKTVGAVGFCMGGEIVAEAVALGYVSAADVDCIVLMALGLFYETAIDGRLKSEDRALERLACRGRKASVTSIDPRVAQSRGDLKAPWPVQLNDLYQLWPGALKSHANDRDEGTGPTQANLDPIKHMCNRLSFMYGMPYHHGNLSDEVHEMVPQMFGGIPLHMCIHGSRNIRQGQATQYNKPSRVCEKFVSDEARERFRRLSKVTLITGALNRLWHRDSIDLMHEWLTRGNPEYLQKFTKKIFLAYAHQDLLWSERSACEVYPTICAGLSTDTESVTSCLGGSRPRLTEPANIQELLVNPDRGKFFKPSVGVASAVAAVLPVPLASAIPSRNWAGNVPFSPSRLVQPRTLAQLSAAAQASEKVRIVGSLHSFNEIAATDQTWIDLGHLDLPVTFHSPTTVEVPASMKLSEVNERLHADGRALASIGDIDEQQIGGLIATGTHGSGLEWGTMSDLVRAVKIVNGRGKLFEVTGGQELAAARTHLGALGAVVSVTLETVPAHNLERKRMIMPIHEALDPAFMRKHDHAQLFYFPFTQGLFVRTLNRTTSGDSSVCGWSLGRRIEWFKENSGVRFLFALSGANFDPSRIPKTMRCLQRRLGQGSDVAPSYFQMTSVRTLRYHELEMALDLADMPVAFEEVRNIIEALAGQASASERFYAHLPVTLRAVKGVENNLMSPTLGRDTAYVSIASRTGFLGYEQYFQRVEKVLRERFGARPHWGKRHWINPVSLYPGAEAFRSVCRALDPEGKFRNEFIESRLFR